MHSSLHFVSNLYLCIIRNICLGYQITGDLQARTERVFGGFGGSDEPPRTAREFRFFVEDRKLLGITAREIVRVRTSVQRALTSYRDDTPKPEAVEKTVQVYRHVKTVFTCSGDKGV